MQTLPDLQDGDVCGCLVLAILFSVVGQLLVRRRVVIAGLGAGIAVPASLVFFIVGIWRNGIEAFFPTAIVSLWVAALVGGLIWTLFGVLALVWDHSFGPAIRVSRAWSRSLSTQANNRAAARRESENIKRRVAEYESQAPERERQRQEADAAANRKAEAQQRRDEARANCELAYNRYAKEIRERFPRKRLEEFMQKYMGDDREPEFVEERAADLQGIIEEHLGKADPGSTRSMSLDELAGWYQGIKTQIEAQPIEERFKKMQLAQLSVRYQTLVQEALESIKP